VTLSPPASAKAAKWRWGSTIIRWQSTTPPAACTIGAIDCNTIGPVVIGATNWPSPTSNWKMRTPPRSRISSCSPRQEKSAA
jgi:hypothetical protein